MEPTQPPAAREPDPAVPATGGELIVQNGRQEGTRRPLAQPLTLIGQAAGCQVRLTVKGVSPLHCALISGPQGTLLRDLQSAGGTLVNGQRVEACLLRNDDVLTVGPFRFLVRLAPAPAGKESADPSAVQREKDALRIQAAAVAAQQAALTEEEGRLQQRRVALEQQEKQLAGHLEDKRKQLLQLHAQIRQARADLQEQRKSHEEQVGAAASGLAREHKELEEAQAQARAERKRLAELHRRLQQRADRQLEDQRKALARREEELAGERRALEKEAERLEEAKAGITQARLRWNGDYELSRRQLKAAWEQFQRQEQQARERLVRDRTELQERARGFDQREAQVLKAEQDLEEEKRQWQVARLQLDQEAQGLENRIQNQRRKIAEQQQELARLDGALRTQAAGGDVRPELTAPNPEAPPAPVALPAVAATPAEGDDRLAALEKLTAHLADQRLHLAEQWQRLVQIKQHWNEQRTVAAREMETLAGHLHDREQSIALRERALAADEETLRQRLAEVYQLRQSLEACQARLRTRVTSWEGERDRLLVELRGREQAATKRVEALGTLRGRWEQRRRQELDRLNDALGAAEKMRREWLAQRDECLRRQAAVEQRERDLAEKMLALEQYRQEFLGKSADSPAAEKRLERLRRRWATLSAAAERAIGQQRQAVQAEAAQVEQRHRQLQKQAREVAAQEAKLATWQTSWEQEQALARDEVEQLRLEVQTLQALRTRYETQLEELRGEVEKVARTLMDEHDNAMEPVIVQAA